MLKLTGASERSGTTDTQSLALRGNHAPYFDLPDTNGTHVRLSDFENTPTVVMFWATWNTDSADALSILDQYNQRQNASDSLVKVVAIDSLEERSIVGSFKQRGKYLTNILVDTQGSVSEDYKVKSLPTYYFIDASGVIEEVYGGVLSESELVDKIEGILR